MIGISTSARGALELCALFQPFNSWTCIKDFVCACGQSIIMQLHRPLHRVREVPIAERAVLRHHQHASIIRCSSQGIWAGSLQCISKTTHTHTPLYNPQSNHGLHHRGPRCHHQCSQRMVLAPVPPSPPQSPASNLLDHPQSQFLSGIQQHLFLSSESRYAQSAMPTQHITVYPNINISLPTTTGRPA